MIPSVAALAAYLTGASREGVDAALADGLSQTRLQVQQLDLQPDVLTRALRSLTALLAIDAVAACALLEALVELAGRPTLPRG